MSYPVFFGKGIMLWDSILPFAISLATINNSIKVASETIEVKYSSRMDFFQHCKPVSFIPSSIGLYRKVMVDFIESTATLDSFQYQTQEKTIMKQTILSLQC